MPSEPRAGSRARTVVDRLVLRLRSSERSRWWAVFLLVAGICSVWSLATPVFGAPDEPAHAIRAASAVRLELLGSEHAASDNTLIVDAPGVYGEIAGEVSCYAFMRDVSASCASTSGSDDLVGLATSAGRHPPTYYVVAGIPSLAIRSVTGIYLMRVVSAVLVGAFVASAFLTLERLTRPRVAVLGLLLATTPMLFFMGGVVNPSAAEIPAAISLWCAALVLVSEAPQRVDERVLRRLGLAAITVALARQLGPLWLVIIFGAVGGVAGLPVVRALAASMRARLWVAAVGVAVVAQVAWVAVVKPLDPSLGDDESIRGLTTGSALRISFGESMNRAREMVGWFGWLDAPAPGVTYLVWTLAVAALAALAITVGTRRHVVVALAVGALTIAAPIFFEGLEAQTAGFFWQGRYTMPIAVGVPLLLGVAVAKRATPVIGTPRRTTLLVGGVGAGIAIAHLAAFAQALRRNAVGYDGPLDFFVHPVWDPPLPPVLLLAAATVLVVGYVSVLVVIPSDDPAPTPSGSLRNS